MISDFKPNNLLEEKLLALYRKEIKINEFLEMLLDSQSILLTDRDVDISGPNMSFNPLAITSPMGYNVLVTFSSLKRAKAALTTIRHINSL